MILIEEDLTGSGRGIDGNIFSPTSLQSNLLEVEIMKSVWLLLAVGAIGLGAVIPRGVTGAWRLV